VATHLTISAAVERVTASYLCLIRLHLVGRRIDWAPGFAEADAEVVRNVDAGTAAAAVAGIDSGCCRTEESPASLHQADQLHRTLADAAAAAAAAAAAVAVADAAVDTSAVVVD